MHHSPKASLSGLQHDELHEAGKPTLTFHCLLHVQLYHVVRGPDGVVVIVVVEITTRGLPVVEFGLEPRAAWLGTVLAKSTTVANGSCNARAQVLMATPMEGA